MTLTPGIYKATVRGEPDTIVILVADAGDNEPWASVTRVKGGFWHGDSKITDARPLIVLDLEDPAEMVHILRGVGLSGDRDRARADGSYTHIINGSGSARRLGIIADQIEAQAKPPRVPEPSHGERVTASLGKNGARREFLRIRTDRDFQWVDLTDGHVYMWSALKDPSRGAPC
jgi:hypothetical protein